MAEFMVNNLFALNSRVLKLSEEAGEMKNYSGTVNNIKNQLAFQSYSYTQVCVALDRIIKKLDISSEDFEEIASCLQKVLEYYRDTELEIIGASREKNESIAKDGTEGSDDKKEENPDEKKSILEQIQEKFHLSETEMSIIMLILGFIPGLNCVADIISLINDIQVACKDDKWSKGEILTVALDVVSLAADVLSLGQIINAMEGVASGVKVAKAGSKMDKATDVLRGADQMVDRAKNSRFATNIKNNPVVRNTKQHVDDAVNAAKNSRAGRFVTDTSNAAKNSAPYQWAADKANRVKGKADDIIADRIHRNSGYSNISRTDANNAASKYTDAVASNIKGTPKTIAQNNAKAKAKELLDRGDAKEKKE